MNSIQGNIPETWTPLTSIEQLEEAANRSHEKPVVLFKHSTRCGISAAAKTRLESAPLDADKATFYYLDLLSYRPISNAIAEKFEVAHQSPQVIVLHKGKALHHNSHHAISPQVIEEWIAPLIAE